MLGEKELLRQLKRQWEYSGRTRTSHTRSTMRTLSLSFLSRASALKALRTSESGAVSFRPRLQFHIRRITHRDDLVVAENLISCDGAPWKYSVNLLEFRGDRVAHERVYIMDPWDAPAWRAPWRSDSLADPVLPAPASPA